MKKLVSLLLALVLVFSLGVPSFASSFDTELDALNDIAYWVWALWNDIGSNFADLSASVSNIQVNVYNSLSQLIDINDYTRQTVDELQRLNNNLFGDSLWLQSFGSLVLAQFDNLSASLSEIVTVLADEDDVALKDSQKDNQELIQDTFFNSGSNLSVSTNKIGNLSNLASSFTDSFDLSKYGSGSPLEYLGEGSAFASWFTEEVGKDMDPTYSAPSGDDSFPWPDIPDDPDNPDEPDEPDVPVPETTAAPVISYNSYTFTVSASGNGTVILYVNGSVVSNPYTFTQTSTSQTFVVTATAQETDKLISDTARQVITVPSLEPDEPDEPDVPVPETTAAPVISYNSDTFTVSASGNGTVILYVNGSVVSNPYTFTQTSTSQTFVVTATAQETDKLISDTARQEITIPALSVFPAVPTAYNLIDTYTSSLTFTAPEDGYYQVEVFGASGNGGTTYMYSTDIGTVYYGGGGGGGGAYCLSNVIKLKAGDTIFIGGTLSPTGTVTVYINSSLASYSNLVCVSGSNGVNGARNKAGAGGSGGTASGGNVSNLSGSSGSNGSVNASATSAVGIGGASAVSGGNIGGNGKESGSPAFVKIYRGNTNVVASTFSLRAPKVDYTTPASSDTIVTSFYQKRNFSLLELLFGGAK